jgi:RNA polymerase sigma factor (sigma-70 family)
MQDKKSNIEDTFRKQAKKLKGYIRKFVPAEVAEDILQDIFTRLIIGYEEIRNIESLTSWLYKSASNRIIDFRKKKKPGLLNDLKIVNSPVNEDELLYLEDVLPAFSDNPEDEMFRKDIWDSIMETLDELPTEFREVFVLHEFEDMSFREIEKITGEKINTLISRKHYAVLYLRERLDELYQQLKN